MRRFLESDSLSKIKNDFSCKENNSFLIKNLDAIECVDIPSVTGIEKINNDNIHRQFIYWQDKPKKVISLTFRKNQKKNFSFWEACNFSRISLRAFVYMQGPLYFLTMNRILKTVALIWKHLVYQDENLWRLPGIQYG